MAYLDRGRTLGFFLHLQSLIFVLSYVSTTAEFGFHFLTRPSWKVVAPGSQIELGCSTNLPYDDIRWLQNHQFVNVSTGNSSASSSQTLWVEKDGQTGSKLSLKISSIKSSSKLQEGLYQCVASVGAVVITSLPGRIEVASLKPFSATSWNRTVKLEAGSNFRIPCPKPESIPDAIISYYRKGKIINLSKEKDFFASQSGDLIVLRAGSATKGWFSCTAYNYVLNRTVEYGTYTRIIVKKTLQKTNFNEETPRLVSSDTFVSTLVGKTEKILCLATNPPADSLYWSFQNYKPNQYSVFDNDVSVVITNISANDEGFYRCHAKNYIGASFVDVTVLVQEPPFVIEHPRSQSVPEMTNLTLVCSFGGNPLPVVAWVFNGQLLASSKNILVDGNTLNFHLIKRNQSGIYQCFGFSAFGSAEGSTIVTVIPMTVTAAPYNTEHGSNSSLNMDDKIDEEIKDFTEKQEDEFPTLKLWKEVDLKAPTRPRITKLSDESVMVTWEMDSEDGLPVLFFKVQYKTLSGPNRKLVYQDWKTVDDDIPPHVRSFEITELKPDHVYRFRVAAVYINNDNQLGPSSKKFLLMKDIKLQRPEESPEILTVVPDGKSSVVVSWQYETPTLTEGFIISYRESTSAADYVKITLLGESKRNYTVTYLIPDTSYDFKICSFNMAGTSDYSERIIYIPKGLNFTRGEEQKNLSNFDVPIVRSDPDGMSSSILYIALGTGLSTLLIIVIASFFIYSCQNKNSTGSEIVDSKFMDTSLRIHRTCSLGHCLQSTRNGSSCHCQTKNQVPLLRLENKGNYACNTSFNDTKIFTKQNLYGSKGNDARNEPSEERNPMFINMYGPYEGYNNT